MSIFDKFNNHGMGNKEAFEELCCQLFESWGRRQMEYDGRWTYRNIRGAGGDGGIEAYWQNSESDEIIGLQAKWFRKSITPGQYGQIKDSIDTVVELRPNMHLYVVCIPHDLTSTKRGRGKVITRGEDSNWYDFEKKVAKEHPALKLELWDEAEIFNHLQRPENEGRMRFWFEKSLVNPDAISLSLEKTLASLRNRYVPELADDGELSVFLDSFFGTEESRNLLIGDIDKCIRVCRELDKITTSFIAVGSQIPDDIGSSALACKEAISDYAGVLASWRELASFEPDGLRDIEPLGVDYPAIECFESHIQALKSQYKFHGHVDALLRLFDQFRELPSEWELANRMKEAFGSPHCIIIGDQGTGKTCGFANKARELLYSKMHVPIFVKAVDVGLADTWLDVVVSALGLDGSWSEASLWQALSSTAAIGDLNGDSLAIRAKVAILVDGLDENPPASSWAELIRQADAITDDFPRIRFAYSSRRSGIDFDRDLMGCRYYIDEDGDVPVWKLFDRYIEHYKIDLNGHERYKWMFRTPMELCMFCTAYAGQRITDDVSTCMTGLVDAELDRLEREFRDRRNPSAERHSTPVRRTLAALASHYLESNAPLERGSIGKVVEESGVDKGIIGEILDFLDEYGILYVSEQPGRSRLSPKTVSYKPGSRHLWDYFMALTLVEDGHCAVADILDNHPDATEMYGILLIEQCHMLPLDFDDLVGVIGMRRARELTFDALAEAEPAATAMFKQWALDEMRRGKEEFFEIVNNVVLQVAFVRDHPLGPSLLDEHLRTYASPALRDVLWAVPRNLASNEWYAMYNERDAVRHLPRLHSDDTCRQMPLVAAWGLASVSNLRRRHFRNELVEWGLGNPQEFTKLFGMFCDCDDPQIREDMFALAEEIVCMGSPTLEVEAELGRLIQESAFANPDRPGNRDAAVRYYGRILVERCCADGVLDPDVLQLCRPPYVKGDKDVALPVHPEACTSEKMGGYGPISYDLARYVLVDKLESAFGLPLFISKERPESEEVDGLIGLSAIEAGVEIPSFEGWIIAAAYQYLLDHGYDPDVFEGPIGEDGYRKGGIDRDIRGSFGPADHGSKSDVMAVSEKYVWCARNEICGYLADRVPAGKCSWMDDPHQDENGRTLDYSILLSYGSPLFEATITGLREDRADTFPIYPLPFTCDDGDKICNRDDLDCWLDETSPDAAIALLGYAPNVRTSISGDAMAISLFAGDWGLGGKESRVWAYCGIVEQEELDKLSRAKAVAIDGYDNASSFKTSVETGSASYISPIEFMSQPWMGEYGEVHNATKVADVHITAKPLAGEGVDSLTEIGDYWYRFPCTLAMELCGVVRTDGARYINSDGNVVFEDVSFGEPYRREYHALLADKQLLAASLHGKGYKLVWYVTVQRETNSLARERIPGYERRVERSWLLWQDGDGSYFSCPVSEEYPEPERSYEPMGFLKELLEIRSYALDIEESF